MPYQQVTQQHPDNPLALLLTRQTRARQVRLFTDEDCGQQGIFQGHDIETKGNFAVVSPSNAHTFDFDLNPVSGTTKPIQVGVHHIGGLVKKVKEQQHCPDLFVSNTACPPLKYNQDDGGL